MGIFGRRDDESMDPQELLARGHADMAESMAESSTPTATQRGLTSSAFRLTVADVFLIQGRGTVLTGTVESGLIRVGSPARLERGGQVVAQTVVTGIEQFRKIVDQAGPGENVGLLVPSLDRASVQSGDVLTN